MKSSETSVSDESSWRFRVLAHNAMSLDNGRVNDSSGPIGGSTGRGVYNDGVIAETGSSNDVAGDMGSSDVVFSLLSSAANQACDDVAASALVVTLDQAFTNATYDTSIQHAKFR